MMVYASLDNFFYIIIILRHFYVLWKTIGMIKNINSMILLLKIFGKLDKTGFEDTIKFAVYLQ